MPRETSPDWAWPLPTRTPVPVSPLRTPAPPVLLHAIATQEYHPAAFNSISATEAQPILLPQTGEDTMSTTVVSLMFGLSLLVAIVAALIKRKR